MRRDVTLRNLLILKTEPPVAVVCDFAKMIQATVAPHNLRISPQYTLAPEVGTFCEILSPNINLKYQMVDLQV